MEHLILMLEHDDDDRYITQAVFDENNYPVRLCFVHNSNELLAFLFSSGHGGHPLPGLILLNQYAGPLNVVEILKTLKADSRYAHIPVVVLSEQVESEIVQRIYSAGASSFITKPSSGADITRKISSFVKYWFETVELPIEISGQNA